MKLISRIWRKITRTLFPPRLKGSNQLQNDGFLLNTQLDVCGENNEVIIKKGASLNNVKIYIRGNNHRIEIGEKVVIKQGILWIEDLSNKIVIGAGTTIEGAHIACLEKGHSVSIGKDCMFSHDISIRNSDSHSLVDLETKKRLNHASSIHIGNHVWIGVNALILKGTNIGDNCVIGAKSLVAGKTIPPFTLVSGIPAKILKENIDWRRERIYDK